MIARSRRSPNRVKEITKRFLTIPKMSSTSSTASSRDYIEIPSFYHSQWAPRYPKFAWFNYDGASYQIRLRQYQRKLFFADGLKQLRKHFNIYKSVTINFMACEHIWNFDLHFSPSLEQQACGRPLAAFRMHVWTIELTQALLCDPEPLMLPPIAAIHLPSYGFHMTILRKIEPPLQWPVVPVGPGFHDKYVAEPWYQFLAEGDFVHGDELLFYYRSREDIWEMGPSNCLAAIRFSVTFRVSKNIIEVDVIGPIHRQGRPRSVLATRRHIFTADVTEHMMQQSFPLVLLPATLNFLFGSQKVELPFIRKQAIMQFRATFHNDRLIYFNFAHNIFLQDIIKVPFFYHIQLAPKYPEYARFKYNGVVYQIQGKVFFADGLKQFRKELAIYESTIIHFFAIDHILVFDLHFSPPLEQQTSGRPWMISRQHIWTLEITQSMIDAPHPLNLPSCVTRHLNGCDQHMIILRRLGPPLQWNVIVLDIGIGEKYVVQPWYKFLEESNFSHGDEISFYYRHHEQIWEIIIRSQKD
ncbi:hypothetical protein HKD37_15G043936 [Glycine soja]